MYMSQNMACKDPMIEILDDESPNSSLGPVFIDNPCFIVQYTTYSWLEVYQLFYKYNLLEENMDSKVYIVVRISWLHKVVVYPPILLYAEEIKWI